MSSYNPQLTLRRSMELMPLTTQGCCCQQMMSDVQNSSCAAFPGPPKLFPGTPWHFLGGCLACIKCSTGSPTCHIWGIDILIRCSPFSMGANLGHLENVTFCHSFKYAAIVTWPANRTLWCSVHKPITVTWEADGPVCSPQTFRDDLPLPQARCA